MTDKIKHSGVYERLVSDDHDFLGQAAYSIYISKETERIEREHNEKYEKLADSVRPSFWYGVLQGIVASFLFVLSGYIILKMNGSWDILLSNLLK